MNDARKTWERYVSSWKAEGADQKRALFDGVLSPRCVYRDPLTERNGQDELLAYMLEFHEQVPGAYFVTDQFIVHHGRSMARWTMKGPSGQALGDGVSIGEYDDDGKLVSMTGFYETERTQGLSYYLERIQRGVDFVETRLDDDVALSSVAKAGGLSQWHFQRVFKSLTGETLKGYIRSRRLARPLERLLDTDLRVLDIALLAGFDSQEAFARAFKKAFGVTPMEYRQRAAPRIFVKKPVFDAEYLRHVNAGISLQPTIESLPAMLLVGMRTHFYGADSELNDFAQKLPALWGEFLPHLKTVPNRIEGAGYGVIQQEREDHDRLEYHAAVAVTEFGTLPPGLVSTVLPAAAYARFVHRGPVKDLDHTVSYAYSTWLAGSGHRRSGGPDLEVYREGEYDPTSDDSVIHYAMPVVPA